MTKTKPLAALIALAGAVAAVALLWPSRHSVSAPPTPVRTTTTPVVLHLSGTGSTVTPTFAAGPDWSIRYTFDCADAPGFQAIEHGGPGDGVPLADDPRMQGTGTTYAHAEPGAHAVRIDTACRWTITVTDGDTLPRATGGAS